MYIKHNFSQQTTVNPYYNHLGTLKFENIYKLTIYCFVPFKLRMTKVES